MLYTDVFGSTRNHTKTKVTQPSAVFLPESLLWIMLTLSFAPFHCPKIFFVIVFLCVTLPADTEDVCIVERLFSSSLVAIVSLKAPRKLKVCHFKKGTEICNYSYSNTILAVKLNRQVGRWGLQKDCQLHMTCTLTEDILILLNVIKCQLGKIPHLIGACPWWQCCQCFCGSLAETDCVSGRIALHSQHQRHESAAHYQRNSTQPLRCVWTRMRKYYNTVSFAFSDNEMLIGLGVK